MHSSAEDRTEHDPQKHHRPEAGSHQRAEDRPGTCDIQQLHQKSLPGFHRHTVHAVVNRYGRRLPVIRREYTFCQSAVDSKPDQQYNKR